MALTVAIFIVGRSVTLKLYLNETRFQLEDFKIALGHETEESISKKLRYSPKRTPMNLLARILIYPILLSAIALSI